MFHSLRHQLLQNLMLYHKLQRARNVAYQFKVQRPIYYPDRQTETKRINQQNASELVAETTPKKRHPKDYYYKILGLKRQASTQQIKTAYYALAKRFHPDANKAPAHESRRFQEISNAYHILTDETRRLEYDQLGEVRDEQSFLQKMNSSENLSHRQKYAVPSSREDMIKMTTGEMQLDLTFLEAAHGLRKNIDLRFLKKCPTCNGKSPKLISRTNPGLCRKCQGAGQLCKKTATYTSITVCDMCNGKRYVNKNECETCDNRGIVMESVRTSANVPPGAKTGDTVNVENPITKQRVNFRLFVQPSDVYHREGNNVLSDKYLTISEAVLGGTFKVRGIHGDIDVKLEAGTCCHTQVVLKGKGIKTSAGIGDHIVTFKVRIPRQLSVKQRQLILALAKTEDPTFERTAG